MKKNILLIGAIVLIGAAAAVVSLQWNFLTDSGRPEFAQPTGNFISGPEAHIENSVLTITWSATDVYEVNSIYFKKRWSRFTNYGGGNVNMQYDATTTLYNYSAQFEVGLPATHGPDGYAPYIEPGQYTYQVSGTTDDSKKIVSPVLDLNASI